MSDNTTTIVMAGQAKRDPATQGRARLDGRVTPGHDGCWGGA
jgi:hypothetical protein